jgi:class 3 adenylate cyclase
VLFTDIVDSTVQLALLGDGFLATVDRPGQAIRAAAAIVHSVAALGLSIRAGLHSGEIELMGEDVGGIAVHIAHRISSVARPGAVLVSSTVKDLVDGSGIEFDDLALCQAVPSRSSRTITGVSVDRRPA